MSKNKCPNCSLDIEKSWNFCPRCGTELPKWYDKFSYGLDSLLVKVAEDLKKLFMEGLITISFSPSIDSPHSLKNPSSINKKWDVKKVEEPVVKYEEKKNAIEVDVITPEIKSEKDVDISIQNESVEVRVYDSRNKTLYFKLIKIPEGTKLINRQVVNNQLKIIFVKGESYYHPMG